MQQSDLIAQHALSQQKAHSRHDASRCGRPSYDEAACTFGQRLGPSPEFENVLVSLVSQILPWATRIDGNPIPSGFTQLRECTGCHLQGLRDVSSRSRISEAVKAWSYISVE